jgi:hypothetical protein
MEFVCLFVCHVTRHLHIFGKLTDANMKQQHGYSYNLSRDVRHALHCLLYERERNIRIILQYTEKRPIDVGYAL